MTIHRSLLAFIGIGMLLYGCAGSNDSARLAEESTDAVLVPVDGKYRDSWRMEVKDSPNNYSFRSNWSAEFDPDVDPDSTVIGYQVSDVETFSGGDLTGTGQAERDAVLLSIDDSSEASEGGGPCEQLVIDPAIARCSYDIGGAVGQFSVLVRHFDDVPATMVVLYPNDAAVEYLSGDFEAVDTATAVERWHTTRW